MVSVLRVSGVVLYTCSWCCLLPGAQDKDIELTVENE